MVEQLKQLYEKLELIKKYAHAAGIVGFDFETIVPEDAKEDESEILNFLSNEIFKIANSDETKELIKYLHEHIDEIECPLDKKLVEYKYEDYLKEKNFTEEFAMELDKTYNKSFMDWYKARNNNDFSQFVPALEKVDEMSRKAIDLRENKLDNYYDNLLNDCEKGVLQEDLDKFFKELKEGLLDILNKIKNSKHQIRIDFLNREVKDYQQEEFGKYLLELQGYDFKRGLLQTTEHPFTSNVAKNDARVTTHYYNNMVLSSMYSCIHEGGHAIFMQSEPKEDYEHFINDNITNGMHESVSRFYENVIGRSKEYVHLIYPKFKSVFAPTFDDVSEQELYEAINYVTPSLIRTEADEVTYGLHIIIRYELEKMICNKEIEIKDLAQKWNQLYKEYLGIDVPDDRQGVLQDVHWSSGFGYFPSYALGNSYNQMYLHVMQKDFDLYKAIENQEFGKIKEWLKDHVFIHANRLTPKEWIKEITGEDLTCKYFLDYLNKKYGDIYKF